MSLPIRQKLEGYDFAFSHNRRYPSLTRLPSCRCYRLVFVTGLPDLRLILRAIMNRPNRASPNEIRITSSVAKLSPVRLELGAGPADGSVNFTIPWPNELFSRFVSPCTGSASAESSYVDAGYPAVFHNRSMITEERGLTLTLSTAKILVWLASNCT